jgi:Trk-type K+ transport system membrane component
LRDVPTARKELGLLVQERDSVKKIYDELLGRMSQSEVSKQMEIGNKAATFRIVDPAVLPKVPVSPNMLKMFILAIAGGLACGMGLIFLLENLDPRIRDVEVLESNGFDVLAVVPNIVDGEVIRKRRLRNVLLFFSSSLYFVCFSGVFVYVIFIK